jgi:hypothetical protein
MHVHLDNVIALACYYNVKTVVMERHLISVYHSFGELIKEKYPCIVMNMISAYQLTTEDLMLKYNSILYKGRLLHACIYINCCSQQNLAVNMRQRGREIEIDILGNQKIYPYNISLEFKHKYMLEILNMPVLHVKEKNYNTSKIIDFIKSI